jgi:hypothetical protein
MTNVVPRQRDEVQNPIAPVLFVRASAVVATAGFEIDDGKCVKKDAPHEAFFGWGGT